MKLKYVLQPPLLLVALVGLPMTALAQVQGPPAFVDYQGTVYKPNGQPFGSVGTGPNSDQPPFTAAPENKTMEFRIYDIASGGTEANIIWAETQIVTVSLGQFSVRLGSGAKIVAPIELPHERLTDAFNGRDRFLELTVINPGETPSPIQPRLAFQSSPFSFVAERAKVADQVESLSGALLRGTSTDPVRLEGNVNAANATFAFANGTFQNGTFQDGTFEGAAVNDGIFTGGTFSGGTFSGGTFVGDGSGLTSVPTNVALLDAPGQVFQGNRSIMGDLKVTNLKVGNLERRPVVGEPDAPLRIVRGVVNAASSSSGPGWTAELTTFDNGTQTRVGNYTITFDPAFADDPVVTATTVADGDGERDDNFIQLDDVSSSKVQVFVHDSPGLDGENTKFHFIAIGAR